jgi:polyhydroxyalkanoate synthesis regulator phasin
MEAHRVKEHKDLVRDPNSGAIVNTNRKAYQEAVDAHKRATASRDRITELENQVDELHNKIDSIIAMVTSTHINKVIGLT